MIPIGSKPLFHLAGALIVALAIAPSAARAVSFSPDELARLRAGKTVRQELPSSRKEGFYGGSSFALVDAPADVVWRTLIDLGSYTTMFPNTKETTEVSRNGDLSLVRMRLGNSIASVLYHVEMKRNAAKRTLSFHLAAGFPSDLDGLRGYWRLFPQPDGRTLIAYVFAINAPRGLVNLIGPELGARAVYALLGVPGYMKRWLEDKGRSRDEG